MASCPSEEYEVVEGPGDDHGAETGIPNALTMHSMQDWQTPSAADGAAQSAEPPSEYAASSASQQDIQSVATSALDQIIEQGGNKPVRGDGRPAAALAPSAAELHYWDRRAAVGNIEMCQHRFPMHVNIMLYGESGLGKTTTIRNLIGMNGSWRVRRQGAAFQAAAAGGTGAAGKTSLQQFRDDPDSLRIELEPVWDGRSNMELHFSFQDMPGWGDDINLVNSLKTVVDFLLRQRQADYVANRAGQTEFDPVPGAKMRRGITVCLYFVPPHRVKPIDYIMMAAISKLVAVIPVIAKADTFTQQEMEEFRQELLQVIHHSRPSADPQAAGPWPEHNSPSPSPRAAPPVAAGGMVLSVPLTAEHLGEGDIRNMRSNLLANNQQHQQAAGSSSDSLYTMQDNCCTSSSICSSESICCSSNCSSSSSDEDSCSCLGLADELCLQTYAFRPCDLAMVGAAAERLPPFAIVASKDHLSPQEAQEVGGEPGEPYRRYPWGTAFPLNRHHSDLIILKQLLVGHRNAAIHDLLADSWARAHSFAKAFEAHVSKHLCKTGCTTTGLWATSGAESGLHRAAADPALLQPLIDEVCCATCGDGSSELQDRLRTEEQKRVRQSLAAATAEVDRLAAELAAAQAHEEEQQGKAARLKGQLRGLTAQVRELEAEQWVQAEARKGMEQRLREGQVAVRRLHMVAVALLLLLLLVLAYHCAQEDWHRSQQCEFCKFSF